MPRQKEVVYVAVPEIYDNISEAETGVPCVASGVIEKHSSSISVACNFQRVGRLASGIVAIIGKKEDDVSKAYNFTKEYRTVNGRMELLSRFKDPKRSNSVYVFNMAHEDTSPWDHIVTAGGRILSPGLSIDGFEKNVVVFTNEESLQRARAQWKQLGADHKFNYTKWYFRTAGPPTQWIAEQLDLNEEFGLDKEAIYTTYGVDLVKSFNILSLSSYLKDVSRVLEERSLRLTPSQFRALTFMVQNSPVGRVSHYDDRLAEFLQVSRQRASVVRRSVQRKSNAFYLHVLREYDPLQYVRRISTSVR